MANLKNVNLMSQDTFESITPLDDELYAVQFGFMPDYSAGIYKAWNTNITAEKDGVIIANARSDQQTTLKAIVNGNQLPYNDIATSGVLSISFAVSKGDVYKVYDANGTGTIVFYPFK
jgi:hypothetical protein